LDWRTKVELFEEIRREYEFGIGTIAGVARKLKVHRRMVREAIGSALPVPRKKTERPRRKLAVAQFPSQADGTLKVARWRCPRWRATLSMAWPPKSPTRIALRSFIWISVFSPSSRRDPSSL